MQKIDTKETVLELTENLSELAPYSRKVNLRHKEFKEAFFKCVEAKSLNLIPELAQVLEFKQVLDVLYVFAGQKIAIPDSVEIISILKDLDIYFSIKASPTPQQVEALAKKYNIAPFTVKKITERLAVLLGDTPPFE